MKNIVFSIKKKSFFKLLFYGQICSLSLIVKIDDTNTIVVPPAQSVSTELSVGTHSLRASLPFRGNELGAVMDEITIEPNKTYEIVYDTSVSWSTNSYVGHFEIKEII